MKPGFILATVLAITFFAANSLINRIALSGGHIDPLEFGSIRIVAGAMTLFLLITLLNKKSETRRSFSLSNLKLANVIWLLIYIFGFTLAYATLDAGLGALILFGVVQLTMFTGAILKNEPTRVTQWLGAGIAFTGLVFLLWPDEVVQLNPLHVAFMALAGVGWGLYSLAGKSSKDALGDTFSNFAFAVPVAVLVFFFASYSNGNSISAEGWLLAITAGGLTSGLGYAIWYSVLPKMTSTTAAVIQLTVPVIAMLGGIVLLDELWTTRLLIAAVLVMSGVALTSIKIYK